MRATCTLTMFLAATNLLLMSGNCNDGKEERNVSKISPIYRTTSLAEHADYYSGIIDSIEQKSPGI